MLKARQLTALLTLSLTLPGLAACSSDDDGGGDSPATGGTSSGGTATGGSATGGTATGGAATGGNGNPTTFPADTSAASIAAFLDSEAYKAAPWIGDAATRTSASLTNPHGMVRVFFNPAVAPAIGADAPTFAANSMIVKELYDSAGALVGKAANLHANPEDADWTFFCYASNNQCDAQQASSTEADPIYGVGTDVTCGFCHDGSILAPAPAP